MPGVDNENAPKTLSEVISRAIRSGIEIEIGKADFALQHCRVIVRRQRADGSSINNQQMFPINHITDEYLKDLLTFQISKLD